jgi:thiol:disulfide interchange protein DsbC
MNIPRTVRVSRLIRVLGVLGIAAACGNAVLAATTDIAGASVSSTVTPRGQPAPPPVSPQYAELAKKLATQFPGYSIDSIKESGVDGILEVVVGGREILYSDRSGTHVFNGHLFALDTHEDLTGRRLAELTRVDSKQLPLADAFDVVHGNGKRQVSVFSDPDCPFCKRFEEQLPKVNDVTIHVFLYPLTSLHPHAYEHALGIWCAKDRQKAWSDKMLKGIDPATATCANPIERNLALGDRLHVDGTPTIVFADGRMHAGFVSADEFERLLSGAH